MTDREAELLGAGGQHYRAFVGPPAQYDLMGASQFALLVTLGLRAKHRVLDFGCGSLRLGSLLIPYLARGHYHGLDPNTWLIQDGMKAQLGDGVAATKWPHFFSHDDFDAERCGRNFDFIVAQSIFSHAGPDLTAVALRSFKRALGADGLVAMTAIDPEKLHGGHEHHPDGWLYPDCVSYARSTFAALLADAGLVGRPIPWFHPRQTWYLVAHSEAALPSPSQDVFLRGPILREPDWADSLALPSP